MGDKDNKEKTVTRKDEKTTSVEKETQDTQAGQPSQAAAEKASERRGQEVVDNKTTGVGPATAPKMPADYHPGEDIVTGENAEDA